MLFVLIKLELCLKVEKYYIFLVLIVWVWHKIGYHFLSTEFHIYKTKFTEQLEWKSKHPEFKLVLLIQLNEWYLLGMFHHHSLNVIAVALLHSSLEISRETTMIPYICAYFSLFKLPWNLFSHSCLWHHLFFTWCQCMVYVKRVLSSFIISHWQLKQSFLVPA